MGYCNLSSKNLVFLIVKKFTNSDYAEFVKWQIVVLRRLSFIQDFKIV